MGGQARDAQNALAAAVTLARDLMLMATRPPRLRARAILTARPAPIVLITGYAAGDSVRRATEAGIMAYRATPLVRRPRS